MPPPSAMSKPLKKKVSEDFYICNWNVQSGLYRANLEELGTVYKTVDCVSLKEDNSMLCKCRARIDKGNKCT